jgi:hypothetical protein
MIREIFGSLAPSASPKKVGWTLLSTPAGRRLLRYVCDVMVRRLETSRGAPLLESRLGVVRLWREERFRSVATGEAEPWTLDDGTILDPDDRVLEMHIHGGRLCAALESGRAWREVIAEEFGSLAPLLADHNEKAIVGTTILKRQVISFGASVRPAQTRLHSTLDTFYRRLILIAFHPGGASRVLRERQRVVDAAISIPSFVQRFR